MVGSMPWQAIPARRAGTEEVCIYVTRCVWGLDADAFCD